MKFDPGGFSCIMDSDPSVEKGGIWEYAPYGNTPKFKRVKASS